MTEETPYLVNSSNKAALYVYLVVASQDLAANRSTLKLGMYVEPTGTIDWGDWGGSYLGVDAYAGGSRQTKSFMADATGGGRMWLVENVEVTVNHQAGGTAANVPVVWAWGVNSSWGSFVKPSGTLLVTLPALQRASVPTVSTAAGKLGLPLTVYTNRANGTFTHTIAYSFAGQTGTIATGVGDSVTWTPPASLASAIPTQDRATCQISCTTYAGSQNLGTNTCSFTLSVGDLRIVSAQAGWFTIAPAGPGAQWGVYLAGESQVKATFDETKVTPGQGASLEGFRMTVLGVDYSAPYLSDVIHQAGQLRVTGTAEDSRGTINSTAQTVTVLAYAPPSVTVQACYRADSTGQADGSGAYLWVKAQGVYASAGGHNSCTLAVKVYAKATGALVLTQSLQSGVGQVCGGSLSPMASYQAEIQATDGVGNVGTVTVTIPSQEIAFHIREGGDGAAFGGAAETGNCLDVKWDNLKVGGSVVQDFPVEQSIDGQWIWRKWKSGLAEVWGEVSKDTAAAFPVAFVNTPVVINAGEGGVYAVGRWK